jgi:hypothetical protein
MTCIIPWDVLELVVSFAPSAFLGTTISLHARALTIMVRGYQEYLGSDEVVLIRVGADEYSYDLEVEKQKLVVCDMWSNFDYRLMEVTYAMMKTYVMLNNRAMVESLEMCGFPM